MAIISMVQVIIRSRNNRELPQTHGSVQRIDWETSDHPKNAAKFLGLGLAATFASAMIPLLHWVLVPVLFISTFVFSIEKFREKARNEGGQGECPKCHQNFVIEKSKWQDRITDTCGNCHDDLEVYLATPVFSV